MLNIIKNLIGKFSTLYTFPSMEESNFERVDNNSLGYQPESIRPKDATSIDSKDRIDLSNVDNSPIISFYEDENFKISVITDKLVFRIENKIINTVNMVDLDDIFELISCYVDTYIMYSQDYDRTVIANSVNNKIVSLDYIVYFDKSVRIHVDLENDKLYDASEYHDSFSVIEVELSSVIKLLANAQIISEDSNHATVNISEDLLPHLVRDDYDPEEKIELFKFSIGDTQFNLATSVVTQKLNSAIQLADSSNLTCEYSTSIEEYIGKAVAFVESDRFSDTLDYTIPKHFKCITDFYGESILIVTPDSYFKFNRCYSDFYPCLEIISIDKNVEPLGASLQPYSMFRKKYRKIDE